MMWTLEEAVKLARELHVVVQRKQAWVALSGGVLIHGKSSSDLDLQVVPRSDSITPLWRVREAVIDSRTMNVTKVDLSCSERLVDEFECQGKKVEVCWLAWPKRLRGV
jgi:hypothetical protein